MGLRDIFILAGLLILLRVIPNRRARHYALLVCGAVFVFTFQPTLPIREADFMLPLLTVGLTLIVYAAFTDRDALKSKENLTDAAVIFGTLLLLCLTRFLGRDSLLTASRPPMLRKTIPALLLLAALACLAGVKKKTPRRHLLGGLICLILAFLVILKTPALALLGSRLLRSLNGQSAENALSGDLRWFGFSYIAFRLLSALIDARKGRKISTGLGAFFIYVCFPPTLSAGPIDRWDRFTKEYAAGAKNSLGDDLREGLLLIAHGLFCKFILADALSLCALSAQNAGQFIHTGWAWVSLFAYALQIYFDFSGYSEIALGLGRFIGITLPKNFDHPYLKSDLTKFWSSWHITLTQWIRSYVFNPLTRALRAGRERPLPQWLIVLITQLVTMLLIGLWHGVSVNFVIWGLWHGIGLFVHQLWARHTGAKLRTLQPALQKTWCILGTCLTVLYVTLGWVWFVTPDFGSALAFYGRLFS